MNLTVAVCTYRRGEWLRRCLEALNNQTLYPSELRILVVDNSLSRESSSAFARTVAGRVNLEYLITDKAGLSFARNLALAKCETPYIAFIDDDAVAAPDWAEQIVRCFEARPGTGAVGGKVDPIWEVEPPIWLEGRLRDALAIVDWGDDPFVIHPGTDPGHWLVGANCAYRASALRAVGGFDERIGRKGEGLFAHDELAVNFDIESLGYDVLYCPAVRVEHLVQKERVTVEWIVENAFYEGASRVLFENPSAQIDHDAARAALRESLAELSALKPTAETTQAAFGRCREANQEGRRVVSELLRRRTPNHQAQGREGIPVIFIVTPCLNASATVDETIHSVVSQAGDFSIRYHVQDGGSTDATLDRLAAWEKRLASGDFPIACKSLVFTYESAVDDGMYAAIRKGFGTMRIPDKAFMGWVNADDLYHQNAFATVVGAGRDLGDACQWIGQSPVVINEKGETIAFHPTPYPREIIAGGICDATLWPRVQQEGAFWRRALWDKVGGLNPSLKLAGDWDLWRRFAQHADLVQVPWVLGVVRKRGGQLSSIEGGRRYREELDAVLAEDVRGRYLADLAARGRDALFYSVIRPDYLTQRYHLVRESVRDGIPSTASTFFVDADARRLPDIPGDPALTHATAPGGDLAEVKMSGACVSGARDLATAGETALPPEGVSSPKLGVAGLPAADRVVFGSRAFRKCYAHSPPLVQKAFRVVKYSGVLRLLEAIRPWRMARTIRHSGLFFTSYYLKRRPEIAGQRLDPIEHYIRNGFVAGYDPNPLFDSCWYASMHPELKAFGISPLYHYVKVGAAAGYDPSPHFSAAAYCNRYPSSSFARQNALLHCLCVGLVESGDHTDFLR